MADLQTGLVVAAHGRHCMVESTDGERRICHPRGKKSQVVVGDEVQWQITGDEGSIERVNERRNLFYRQDEMRTKSFAANLDQVLVLVAADPEFSESQLARALIASQAERIEVLIVLNKSDLQPAFDRAWARLDPYRRMGCTVMPLRLKAEGQDAGGDDGLDALQQRLAGQRTLVLGPSGVGKSTLVNRLVPTAKALTGEISRALNSGKHTTTSTSWYWVDAERTTALIDSPGFQEFGLNHIEPMQLAPDARPQRHAGQLPLLQLHPLARTGLRGGGPCADRRCRSDRWRSAGDQRKPVPPVQRVVRRALGQAQILSRLKSGRA